MKYILILITVFALQGCDNFESFGNLKIICEGEMTESYPAQFGEIDRSDILKRHRTIVYSFTSKKMDGYGFDCFRWTANAITCKDSSNPLNSFDLDRESGEFNFNNKIPYNTVSKVTHHAGICEKFRTNKV